MRFCRTATEPYADISQSAAVENYQTQADREWQIVVARYPDAERPEISDFTPADPTVRPEMIAECLRDAGYADATAHADGSIGVGPGTEAQDLLYRLSNYTCYATHPYEAIYNSPPTEEQLEWLYYYFTHDLQDCLAAEGYTVADEAPSFAQFRDAMNGNGGEYWSPYNALPEVDQGTADRLRATCVEYPEEYYGR